MKNILSNKPTQYLAIGLLAVAGTAGLLTVTTNASPMLSSESVKTALQSGDLTALKTALTSEIKTKSEERLEKVNNLTDADLQNLKTMQANQESIQAKNTEYEEKLTNILKTDINNKDAFKTTAKEYFESVKTLREQQQSLRQTNPLAPNKNGEEGSPKTPKTAPEITDTMLDNLYNKSVEQVKAGNSVSLGGERGMEGMGKQRGGKMMK
jgi:hypothetical protein